MFGPSLWEMSPNLNAAGTQTFGNYGMWGGAASLTTVGTLSSTCSNWTLTSGTAIGGRVGYTLIAKFFANDPSDLCTSTINKVACLQQ